MAGCRATVVVTTARLITAKKTFFYFCAKIVFLVLKSECRPEAIDYCFSLCYPFLGENLQKMAERQNLEKKSFVLSLFLPLPLPLSLSFSF
jgi:hypothetical protein